MLEALEEWIAGVAILVTTLVAGWAKSLSGRLRTLETNDALQDAAIKAIPTTLGEIRDEIKGLREDGRNRSTELYKHIDNLRLEIKSDLAGKQDKQP